MLYVTNMISEMGVQDIMTQVKGVEVDVKGIKSIVAFVDGYDGSRYCICSASVGVWPDPVQPDWIDGNVIS